MSEPYVPMTFEGLRQKAIDVCLKNGGHYPTMFIAGDKNANFAFFNQLPPGAMSRVELAFKCGLNIGMDQDNDLGEPPRVAFVDEAYLTEVKLEGRPQDEQRRIVDAVERGDFELVKQITGENPRREVLLIAGLEVSPERMLLASYDFIRDGSGKLSDLVTTRPLTYDDDNAQPADGNINSMPILMALLSGYRCGRTLKGMQELPHGS